MLFKGIIKQFGLPFVSEDFTLKMFEIIKLTFSNNEVGLGESY